MKSFRYPVLVVISIIMVCGCTRKAPEEGENAATHPLVVDVKASRVVRGDMEETVAVEGTTDVLLREKVVSPIAGTVVSIKGIEGKTVRSGDTLAVIRSKESQAAIDGANVLMQSVKTEAQRAEAHHSYELAVASQNVAAIRATSSGIISARSINQGELVSDGAEVFTIIDLSSLYFAANVPLGDLSRVRTGERCRVSFASVPGRAVAGTVSAIEPAADPQSQSVRARITFAELGASERSALKTDMFGTARIVVGVHRGVLLIPRSALLRNDETNETSLVIVTPDSLAVTIPVSVAAATDSLVEVAGGGLAEGQLVITEGNYGLPDSTRVRVSATEKP